MVDLTPTASLASVLSRWGVACYARLSSENGLNASNTGSVGVN